MTARLGDRIAGAIFLALAVWYWIEAGSYTIGYGDPAGPSLLPRGIAIPMGLFAIYMIVRPDPDPVWVRWPHVWRQVATLVILFAYPLLIEPVGFPLATTLGGMLLARVLGGSWLQAVIAGILMGFGLFFLFDDVFGLPLPVGPIFG